MTAVAILALCEPAAAFDFTARSFGPLFDRSIRLDPAHDTDLCSRWDQDGGDCEYGIDKSFDAWVIDSPATGHPAYAVVLSWAPQPGFFEQHQGAALVLSDLAQPQVDRAERAAVLKRIAPSRHADGSYVGGGTEVLHSVKYDFKASDYGLVTLSLTDTTVPNGLGP